MYNNIKPCWWGSHVWQTIYFIVATYPDNPNQEEIDAILDKISKSGYDNLSKEEKEFLFKSSSGK